jgi:hypothetical protein
MDIRCPLHTLQVFSMCVTRIKGLLQTCGYNGQKTKGGEHSQNVIHDLATSSS